MTFPQQLPMPDAVLGIVGQLEGAGHEAWCVGGSIRDALLKLATSDVDIATSASPAQVQRLFKRTIDVGARFGTIGVFGTDGKLYEVTTYRRDIETDGRRAVVEFGVSLDDDLARRDFTINAIAYHPLTHAWRDNYDGVGDLGRAVVRAVGVPDQRFREDYLRILRAIRFAGRFGFSLDPATRSAATALSSGLAGLSAERVHDEWVKSLGSVGDLVGLAALWHEIGAANVWLPELLPVERLRSLALPPITSVRDVVVTTAAITTSAASAFKRWKGSNREIARAEALDLGPPSPASDGVLDVRRWLATVGDAADDLRGVAAIRHGSDPSWGAVLDAVRAAGDATTRAQLAVTGTDLIKAGVSPGRRVGELLDLLLDRVMMNPEINTRDTLLALVAELT